MGGTLRPQAAMDNTRWLRRDALMRTFRKIPEGSCDFCTHPEGSIFDFKDARMCGGCRKELALLLPEVGS